MGFVGELQEFAAGIRNARQPESNIAHATHTRAVHEAIMESLDAGTSVEVEQFDPDSLGTPTRMGDQDSTRKTGLVAL
jgi:hypothetical protein